MCSTFTSQNYKRVWYSRRPCSWTHSWSRCEMQSFLKYMEWGHWKWRKVTSIIPVVAIVHSTMWIIGRKRHFEGKMGPNFWIVVLASREWFPSMLVDYLDVWKMKSGCVHRCNRVTFFKSTWDHFKLWRRHVTMKLWRPLKLIWRLYHAALKPYLCG